MKRVYIGCSPISTHLDDWSADFVVFTVQVLHRGFVRLGEAVLGEPHHNGGFAHFTRSKHHEAVPLLLLRHSQGRVQDKQGLLASSVADKQH